MNKHRIVATWRRHIPELFENPGRILYIGACVRHFTGAQELVDAGNELTVLEIWEPFLDELKASDQGPLITHAVVGDVRALYASIHMGELPHTHYEYAVFCHGPEHLPRQDVRRTVRQLEKVADTVILVSPDGWMPNPANRDNPYTEHRSAWRVADFQSWNGWEATTDGEDITAWRRHP